MKDIVITDEMYRESREYSSKYGYASWFIYACDKFSRKKLIKEDYRSISRMYGSLPQPDTYDIGSSSIQLKNSILRTYRAMSATGYTSVIKHRRKK